MIKNVRPNTKLRTSSAPPAPAPLDSNWDDDEKTVPGLDLDDPMNEFDRVTAIPELPPEQYVKSLMAAAEDSRVPLPGTAPPAPPPPAPPSAPSAPIQSLAPDEYFSIESDPPPSPRSPDSTAPYAPVLPHNAPTARPPVPTLPSRTGGSPLPPTRRGVVNFDQLDSLSAPARREEPALEVPPPAGAFKEVPSTASAIADMKDRYAMGDFSGALVIAEGILETSPDDPEAPRYAQSCRDVLTQMYSARLGSLEQRVRVAVPSDQIRWLTLDHRAGFLLSLADGGSTIDQILDISGMPRLDALRIMYQLLDQRVISLGG